MTVATVEAGGKRLAKKIPLQLARYVVEKGRVSPKAVEKPFL